ncbi:hypothetical protein OIN60_19825 [Paenibacillus sp. P96]|uniref:Integron-associated effector binding protein domain-containing protein n=1 Tax=Paenibacillus zeirhizosphaerae TaxID=2987519 RepID=A0ABT9FW72_9BACL|nr:hypothetical protein [Paenibacillus sp. P96]MDP4098977.1 hypothetical protein [Paenibacillus sp. P96]
MKLVPKVDINGSFIEDEIMDDSFFGVVPFYSQWGETDGGGEYKEPEIAGYVIGYVVPSGLYKPRFDLVAWATYQEAVSEYQAACAKWSAIPEEERGEASMYVSPEQPKLWIEGLTPEEIAQLQSEGDLSIAIKGKWYHAIFRKRSV